MKMLKATLKHMHKGGKLTFGEMLTLLTSAANRINQRPLGVRHHQGAEPGYCPVTPNLLLMGSRTNDDDLEVDPDTPLRYVKRLRFVQSCFDAWWRQWYLQVFPSLVPVRKWRQQVRNLKEGDVVMVRFGDEEEKENFRMGRVVKAEEDRDGLVRTVSVAMRPRDARERILPYVVKDPWITAVSAQRVVVLCPVEDVDGLKDDPEALDGPVHRCPDAVAAHGPDTVMNVP